MNPRPRHVNGWAFEDVSLAKRNLDTSRLRMTRLLDEWTAGEAGHDELRESFTAFERDLAALRAAIETRRHVKGEPTRSFVRFDSDGSVMPPELRGLPPGVTG